MIAHSYEAVKTEPDCTHMGYTTYTCSACGDSYKADFVDATGHDCEATVVAPTCEGLRLHGESLQALRLQFLHQRYPHAAWP